MRTIKFRAWDRKIKKFRETWQDSYLEIIDGGVYEIIGGYANQDTEMNKLDVEITQYTGINDSNGREIYEGDIVKLDEDFAKAQGYSSTISEVVWDEDGALFDTPKIQYALSKHNSKYFTVIGNIYETPQLI